MTNSDSEIISVPSNAAVFQITLSNSTVTDTQIVYDNLCLVVADTVSQFVPYTGQTYHITFPTEAGTVYGGYIDVINRKLVPQVELITLDGVVNKMTGKFGDTNDGNACLFSTNIGLRTQYDNKSISNVFKNEPLLSYNRMPLYSFFGGSESSRTISFVFPPNTTVADANAWLAEQLANGTPVVVTRHIAEPIHYPLTPTEIKTLLGQNNIWADCGNTEVTYRADTTLYIKRLTESDTDMVADANIVSGQYFMVGNDLYKATVNIASGASVIVGTNATKVSLAQALNEINQ